MRALVEKALAHIIAGDSALKSDIIKQLQVVSAANERDQVARIHLIDVLNSVPTRNNAPRPRLLRGQCRNNAPSNTRTSRQPR